MIFNRFRDDSSLFRAFFFILAVITAYDDASGNTKARAAVGKGDGFPLVFHAERDAVIQIWNSLPIDVENDPTLETVDFTLLRHWGKEGRERPVRVTGRLLRVTYVEDPCLPLGGYYDIWFLFDDQPRVPGRLLAMSIPDSLALDTPEPPGGEAQSQEKQSQEKPAQEEKTERKSLYRHERISAVGCYYRQVAFSDGKDFYTTPTLVVSSIQVLSAGESPAAGEANHGHGLSMAILMKIAALVVFALIWRVLRRRFRRTEPNRRSRSNESSLPDGDCFDPETLEKLSRQAAQHEELFNTPPGINTPPSPTLRDRAFPLFLLGTSLLAAEAAIDSPPEQVPPFSLPFWEEITSLPKDFLLTDEPPVIGDSEGGEVPQVDPPLAEILRRLNGNISEMTLVEHLVPANIDAIWDDWPETFGRVVNFRGDILSVQTLPRAAFDADSSTPEEGWVMIEVCPEAAGTSQSQETGRPPVIVLAEISSLSDNSLGDSPGQRAAVLGCALRRTAAGQGVVLAKRVALLTDRRSLGRLGGDESLLKEFPLVSVSALETMSPEDRKSALERFPLTGRDTYPFYSLLSFVRQLPPGVLREEAKRLSGGNSAGGNTVNVTDLFNRPARFQGEAVTLTGSVKRARVVPIRSEAARLLAGTPRYYELYLYTNESQGYPVVCCTASLPDGFPLGVDDKYYQRVTLSGVLYKLWGYKAASAGQEGANSASPWIAVPLLFAGDLTWHREEPSPVPGTNGVRAVLLGFFALAIAFVFYRRFRSKGTPIRFQIKTDENTFG